MAVGVHFTMERKGSSNKHDKSLQDELDDNEKRLLALSETSARLGLIANRDVLLNNADSGANHGSADTFVAQDVIGRRGIQQIVPASTAKLQPALQGSSYTTASAASLGSDTVFERRFAPLESPTETRSNTSNQAFGELFQQQEWRKRMFDDQRASLFVASSNGPTSSEGILGASVGDAIEATPGQFRQEITYDEYGCRTEGAALGKQPQQSSEIIFSGTDPTIARSREEAISQATAFSFDRKFPHGEPPTKRALVSRSSSSLLPYASTASSQLNSLSETRNSRARRFVNMGASIQESQRLAHLSSESDVRTTAHHDSRSSHHSSETSPERFAAHGLESSTSIEAVGGSLRTIGPSGSESFPLGEVDDTVNLSRIPFPVTTRSAIGEKIEPLRPLTAYNYFFRDERERIVKPNTAPPLDFSQRRASRLLIDHWSQDRNKKRSHRKTHGKISFLELSKLISQKWKELTDDGRQYFQNIASYDFKRFQSEGGSHPTRKKTAK